MRVTDGQTDGRTDRQNYDSQDRPRICSRGKNVALRQSEFEVYQVHLVVTSVNRLLQLVQRFRRHAL